MNRTFTDSLEISELFKTASQVNSEYEKVSKELSTLEDKLQDKRKLLNKLRKDVSEAKTEMQKKKENMSELASKYNMMLSYLTQCFDVVIEINDKRENIITTTIRFGNKIDGPGITMVFDINLKDLIEFDSSQITTKQQEAALQLKYKSTNDTIALLYTLRKIWMKKFNIE